eukprot:CAMPEP_0203662198 /NCGR_PEP_ID=MMETSP0090-20130426/244_1 /ASSEMBLY_ACC=CAM_ASM_001088 /TAXON_ID=426623 /ORGANISM="Chaetoceros affinis, Strain CCMP159" /LENGTH=322 /DNA_ID=CAMNT_0050524953 /DNA_START=93 /DNA_END=1061 /DNA_ORIENTATION=+
MANVKKILCSNAFVRMIFISASASSTSAFGFVPSWSSAPMPMPMPMPMNSLGTSTGKFCKLGQSTKVSKHWMRKRRVPFNKDFTLYYRDDSDNTQSGDTNKPPTTEDKTDAQKLNKESQSSYEDNQLRENGITGGSSQNGFLDKVVRWYNSTINRRNGSDKDQKASDGKIFPLPVMVQDVSLLYYDVFLLLNLTVSISFWVVHRMSLYCIMDAFNEGCLLCILWIASGLYNGSFLYSAADGHFDMTREENLDKGGPKAAGLLGLWTFVGTINMRMVVALCLAVAEHRPVGVADGEELIPLELCFGLVLMSMWRMLHSAYTRV